jgi:hypothetical protein
MDMSEKVASTFSAIELVGFYMSIAVAISFLAVLALGESKNNQA